MKKSYSSAQKIIAVGFVIIILAGNFGLVQLLIHGKLGEWVDLSLHIGVVIIFVGALLLGVEKIKKIDKSSSSE